MMKVYINPYIGGYEDVSKVMEKSIYRIKGSNIEECFERMIDVCCEGRDDDGEWSIEDYKKYVDDFNEGGEGNFIIAIYYNNEVVYEGVKGVDR